MSTSTVIAIVIAVVILGWLIAQYNKLLRMNVAVDEGFAQIEVQLQRRADLIPNLVETVKGYAAHEKEALENVVQARARATAAQGVQDVSAADGMLTQALRGLLAVSEAYPDLKASANFAKLQEELAATENKVSFARQFYNDTVRILNQTVVTIPGTFFKGIAKVGKREFYEIEDPQNRQVPKVNF